MAKKKGSRKVASASRKLTETEKYRALVYSIDTLLQKKKVYTQDELFHQLCNFTERLLRA